MIPTLVTASSADIVSIQDLKAHLRVTNSDEDLLIAALGDAATAYLDGWTGVLGRCIMPQTWQVKASAGAIVLPFPDVTSVSAEYVAGPAVLEPEITACGASVTVTEDCIVTFACAMPSRLLPVAQVAVKLLVGHWYENREAAGAATHETPMAFDMVVSAIRWSNA